MSVFKSLAAEIAKIGESQNFVTAMAHCWFACSVVLILAHWGLTAWVSAPLCVALAAGKEFWFDLKYETTPPQTVMDSVIDFAGYSAGMLIAAGWLAVAKVVCR